MAGLEAALEAYFDRALALPFAFGAADCCLFGADWVRERLGLDPASAWRGYRGERGAARLLARHGGVIGLARTGFGSVGLSETRTPTIGAVGVLPIVTPAGDRAEGVGIFDGGLWATRGREGLVFGRAEPRAAWGVP